MLLPLNEQHPGLPGARGAESAPVSAEEPPDSVPGSPPDAGAVPRHGDSVASFSVPERLRVAPENSSRPEPIQGGQGRPVSTVTHPPSGPCPPAHRLRKAHRAVPRTQRPEAALGALRDASPGGCVPGRTTRPAPCRPPTVDPPPSRSAPCPNALATLPA